MTTTNTSTHGLDAPWTGTLPAGLTVHTRRTERKEHCPQCGAWINHWWSPVLGDPGDVDPRADCTNPACDWGY